MYLVTGGAGFIGSHLTRALVQRGERVRVFDSVEIGAAGRLADIQDDIEWVAGDIRDLEAVTRACRGAEIVFHHAAIASVARSVEEPRLTHEVNVSGTLNLLTAARAARTRRVVYASSSAVYGDIALSPKSETLPAVPVSPYGVQKLAGELYAMSWYRLFNLETVALRYFNVYGPGQDPEGDYAAVIPRFITSALVGQPIIMYGTGQQSRDFIHVSDVVAINLLAAERPNAAGTVLNVGTGRSVTISSLADEIGRALGREVAVRRLGARPGDLVESVADISRLRAILGYEPIRSFASGIADTVAAYQRDHGARAH